MSFPLGQYNAFFFDFDGVIVDSLDIKTDAFGDLFKEYGEEVVQEVRAYHLDNGGVSRYDKFRYYFRHLLNREITQEIIDTLDKQFSRLVVEKVIEAPFIEGVIDVVGQLNEQGRDCFIISATPQGEIRSIVERRAIEHLFKEIVGSPQTKSKNLEYLLDKYKIEGDNALYFGDARSDYLAAQEHSVAFIGVGKKNQELNSIKGIRVISDFKEL